MHQLAKNMELKLYYNQGQWEAVVLILSCPKRKALWCDNPSISIVAKAAKPNNALAKVWVELHSYQEEVRKFCDRHDVVYVW